MSYGELSNHLSIKRKKKEKKDRSASFFKCGIFTNSHIVMFLQVRMHLLA